MATQIYDNVDLASFVASFGEAIAKSGFFGVSNKEQGMVMAAQLVAEKIAPLDLAKRYHVVSGKISMRSDAMLGLYRERGGKVQWTQFDSEAAIATWTIDGVETVIGYTKEDAKLAGLLPAKPGSPWHRHPADMMRARLISKAIRMIAPEVVAGVYTPEEVEDFTAPRQIRNVFPAQPFQLTDSQPTETELVSPKLTPFEQLVALIQPFEAKALAFLIGNKWIKTNLDEIEPVRVQKILQKQEAFIKAVEAYGQTTPIQPTSTEVVASV